MEQVEASTMGRLLRVSEDVPRIPPDEAGCQAVIVDDGDIAAAGRRAILVLGTTQSQFDAFLLVDPDRSFYLRLMKILSLLILTAVASTGFLLTSCTPQGDGIYGRERAGYPYSGQNAKKRTHAEKKYLRPR